MNENLASLPDQDLVEKVKAGERQALEVLCDRYLDVVYNRLRAKLPPSAVEDVTQEVFLAVTRGIKRFRGRSTFRTWISAITRYKVADYYRNQGRQPETSPLSGEEKSSTSRSAWEDRMMVRMGLRRLPPHYQEVLLLRFAEGLLFKDVAKALDISLEAAKSRYRRAVAALAEELEVE